MAVILHPLSRQLLTTMNLLSVSMDFHVFLTVIIILQLQFTCIFQLLIAHFMHLRFRYVVTIYMINDGVKRKHMRLVRDFKAICR